MPGYMTAALAMLGVSIVFVLALPGPQLAPRRAGRTCAALFVIGTLAFLTAAAMILLATITTVPGYVVCSPAFAVAILAVAVWMTMCWCAKVPEPAADGVQDADDGEDGGGGGGGRPPVEDPPRDPGPEGIPWEDFDREREAWEHEHTPAPALDERELAGV